MSQSQTTFVAMNLAPEGNASINVIKSKNINLSGNERLGPTTDPIFIDTTSVSDFVSQTSF
jgi:hypothetical protein